MRVAIVGAGLSGLAAAYLLHKEGHSSVIFERSGRIGGNMHTARFRLGGEERWADLAVNDFNASTYTNVAAVMKALGVPSLPLEDSTSYSTADGSQAYTQDRPNGIPMPPALQDEFRRSQETAYKDARHPGYARYTVARYLEEKEYSRAFAELNLYPRINGMYFAHDTTPATMPFQGIMHYYQLQEGFGQPGKPDRRYFVGGSSVWAEALRDASGAVVELNTEVEVLGGPGGARVRRIREGRPDGEEEFDAVILACHANVALRIIREGMTPKMASVLGAFDYYDSVGVAHTWSRLLPPDARAWATYNILVRQGVELRPYSITYVENRHQNDAENPAYNVYENPEFFVSLNPHLAVPGSAVLRDAQGVPAVASFPHNTVSFRSMEAQVRLNDREEPVQGQNALFFVGGWTTGAGLQEECWISAQKVVEMLAGRIRPGERHEHEYDESAAPEDYAPRYLRL